MTGKFSTPHHIGVIVRDLDNAMKHYESLGIGPFEEFPSSEMDGLTDKTMYGKRIDFKIRAAMCKMGDLELELIQPVKDAALMEDFLKSRGEGIHHIAFLVDNLEEETAKLTGKGYKIVFSVKRPGGGGGVYLDTGKVGGVILEFFKW